MFGEATKEFAKVFRLAFSRKIPAMAAWQTELPSKSKASGYSDKPSVAPLFHQHDLCGRPVKDFLRHASLAELGDQPGHIGVLEALHVLS